MGAEGKSESHELSVSCVMMEPRKDQGICLSLEERKSLSEDVRHYTFSLHILSKYVISSYLEMCSYSSLEKKCHRNATNGDDPREFCENSEAAPVYLTPTKTFACLTPNQRVVKGS